MQGFDDAQILHLGRANVVTPIPANTRNLTILRVFPEVVDSAKIDLVVFVQAKFKA